MQITMVRDAVGQWKWEVTVEYTKLLSLLMFVVFPGWKPKTYTATFLGKRYGLWYKMPETEKVDHWTSDFLDKGVLDWYAGRIPTGPSYLKRTKI